jgi:hypothetical protein
MTTLVWSKNVSLFARMGAPAAGSIATELARITVSALEELKSRGDAGSSWVFNDLHTLAYENNTEVRDNPVFLLAQRFLLTLPSYIPSPELALDTDGEVLFDWQGSGDRLLSVALRDDGRVSYAARISANDRDHGTKQFVDTIPDHLIDLVHQVTEA